jgi:hypothetical protein
MMRFLPGALVVFLAAAPAACGTLAQSCQEFGLAPDTPEFQRCQAAKSGREASATRGAVDMVRALDAMRPGLR